jgi:hypothetical protein
MLISALSSNTSSNKKVVEIFEVDFFLSTTLITVLIDKILLDVVFLNMVNRLLKVTTMELTLANILKYRVILYNRIFKKIRHFYRENSTKSGF